MIGIDTNVLARFLLRDDLAQFELAHALLTERCTTDEPGFISQVVLCELVWVLKGRGIAKQHLLDVMNDLVAAPNLRFEAEERVYEALDLWRDAHADFADILLTLAAQDEDCLTTYTFDRKAAQLENMTLLER